MLPMSSSDSASIFSMKLFPNIESHTINIYETVTAISDSIGIILEQRKRDALKYIQERGVTLDNIVSVVEEMIHNTVHLIERQIYNAPNGQKELEYKKWYLYNIDAKFMVSIENEIVGRFFCVSEYDPTSDEYKEVCNSIYPIVTIALREIKHTHEVSIEIEGRQSYKMVVHYQRKLERFYPSFVVDRNYGFGCWLIPVEEDGCERKRWLQESLVETIGRGVKVTKAIAAIDNPDVREVTDWLNSDESRHTLDMMQKWQNGDATIMRASNGREIFVYKTKTVAPVYIRKYPQLLIFKRRVFYWAIPVLLFVIW